MLKRTTLTAFMAVCSLAGVVSAQVFDGLTLYNLMNSRTTRLIDNNGQTVRSWTGTVNCAYVAYLMPDSSIWRGDVYSGATMRGAAYGGLMQQYDWNGNIVESFIWSNANHQQHHDFCVMPNGHVLLISWERKTAAQAQALGRQNITGEIWPDEVIEYDPVSNAVVWEWHFWDHLIQDVNPALPNYGVVAEHPELLDINLGTVQNGDWMHCNTIDYNAERDEIILTSHNLHEIFVIDHSTTTAEAAGHTGGRRGRGGDFLYRWGNPQNYDRGTAADRVFYVVHGANWIRPGLPGAGDIIVLNNGDRSGTANDYSEVIQITPPLDSEGNYYIAPDSAFGPRTRTWSYSNGSAFYSQHLGGAYRLPNGNTFAILGTTGVVQEITPSGSVVWTRSLGGQIGRCLKYPRDFATGVEDKAPLASRQLAVAVGSPFDQSTTISCELPSPGWVTLEVYDATGRVVARLIDAQQPTGTVAVEFRPGSGLTRGVYFVALRLVPADGSAPERLVRQIVKGR